MEYLGDEYLFFVVEVAYIIFTFYSVFRSKKDKENNKNNEASYGIKRGEPFMSKLHSTYVTLAFLVVLITLNVEPIEGV